MAQELVVRIVGDASSLERTFRQSTRSAKQFDRQMSSITRGVAGGSGAFRGLGRSLAFASAGFLGGFGLTAAIRGTFEEMSNVQKVAAQTNAVIASTGGVAGVTADHVKELGTELLNLSGVDDELIKNAENLLLTFTNIRNVVGKGNDIFDRATRAALNLSVRFDKDLANSAVLVGKALQDPVRGLTSLQRVGVQFSKSQRTLIKNLVESGHVIEAQKVVLGELEIQTKGSAAAAGDTLSGKLNLLKETIRNVAGSIAEQMLPAITKVVDRALAWVTNLENQKRVMDDVKQVAHATADVFNVLRGGFEKLNDITGSTKNSLKILFGVLVAYKGLKLAGALAGIASNVGLIGTNAKTATGQVAGLRGQLGLLKAIGIIGVSILITREIKDTGAYKKFRQESKNLLGGTGDKLLFGGPEELAGLAKKQFELGARDFQRNAKRRGTFENVTTRLFRSIFPAKQPKVDIKAIDDVKKSIGKALDAASKQVAKIAVKPPGDVTGPTRAQLNALFDTRIGRLIDRVQDAPLKGQVRKLQKIAVLIQARIDATKGVARKAELEDKLLEVTRQARAARQDIMRAFLDRLQFNVDKAGATQTVSDDIAALQKLNAALAKRIKAGGDTLALEQKQLEVQRQIIDAQKRQRDARQFRRLGLGPTGEDLIPGVKGLKRQLASVNDLVSGSFLDTRKTRGLLAHIRQVLAGGLGSVSADVRSKVQQILADLKGQLKQSSVDVTRFQQTARGQFTAAGAHPGGALTINGGIHLHGVQDINGLENQLARRARQRARARRGNR